MAGDQADDADNGQQQEVGEQAEVLTLEQICERSGLSARVVARDLRLGVLKDLSAGAVDAWLISRSIAKIERRTRQERPERTRYSVHGKWG